MTPEKKLIQLGQQDTIDPKVRLYWMMTEHLFRKQVRNVEHLYAARDWLRSGGSVIAISNHESMIDPGIASAAAAQYIARDIKHRMWLASSRFYPELYDSLPADVRAGIADDIRLHKEQAYVTEAKLLRGAAALRDIQLLPVIQSKRMGQGKIMRINVQITSQSFAELTDFLLKPGAMVGLSPEGTRDPGTLIPAEPGVMRLFRNPELRERTMFLPIGLVGTREVHHDRSWGNILHPVTITYGPMFGYDDVMREKELGCIADEDVLMMHIAALLPRAKLGHYAQPQFVEFLDRVLPPHFVPDETADMPDTGTIFQLPARL